MVSVAGTTSAISPTQLRSSLIRFACIGVAPPRLFTPQGATPMQAKWIKLDLNPTDEIN